MRRSSLPLLALVCVCGCTAASRPAAPPVPQPAAFTLSGPARSAEIEPVGPQAVALPLYPEASLVRSREIRITLADGRVFREIEVLLDSRDEVAQVSHWYVDGGRTVHRGDEATARGDDTDYRIWVEPRQGGTRIKLLRYFRD